MIRPPQQRLIVLTHTVQYAAEVIDRSGIADLIEGWIAEDRSEASAATVRAPGRYGARALLIGLYLLTLTKQPVSWVALLQLFWLQIDRKDLQILGLSDTIDEERQAHFLGFAPQADPVGWSRADSETWTSEYQRLIKSLDAMFATMRWSPHARTRKQTNQELAATVARLTAEQKALLDIRKERQDRVLNDLIAASVDRDLLKEHLGDIIFDEVVIQVAKALGNTGTRPDKHHAGNPDAGWWQKGEKDTPRWGHGATLVMAAHRPGERRIPTVVIGMSICQPSGGDVAETMTAVREAERTGLLAIQAGGKKRSRYAICDRGFSYKDGLNEALVERNYYLVQDFQKNVKMKHDLDNGAVLFNSMIICPGFETATRQPFHWLSENAGKAETDRHEQRERLLTAGRMTPNGRPQRAVSSGRGRPRKGSVPVEGMRIEVTCPAARGAVRCPAVLDSMKQSTSEVPTVPTAPNPLNTPAACRSTFTSVLIKPAQFKQYGVHLYGSKAHKRLYKYTRAINEQWHSQLRAQHTGGIDGNVFATVGSERVAVIIALAVVETNLAMQRAFKAKHLQADGTARLAPGAAA